MYSNNNQISNFLKRVHVNSHVRSRGPEVKNQKEDYSCYKRGLPESSPMFLTSQWFADLLLITELHVTSQIVTRHLLHSSKSVCKNPSYSPYKM